MANKYALVRSVEEAMKTAAEQFINEDFEGIHAQSLSDVPLEVLAKAAVEAVGEYLMKAAGGVAE